jgi:hypothetical protein
MTSSYHAPYAYKSVRHSVHLVIVTNIFIVKFILYKLKSYSNQIISYII